MTNFKKTLLGVAAAMALAAPAANAALINVGGVVWDPDWEDSDPNSSLQDFFSRTAFTQWFQSSNNGIAVGQTGGQNDIVPVQNPSSPAGNYLYSVGKFSLFNAANNIPNDPDPETNPAVFCPDCELTYEFGGLLVTGADITNPLAPVYTFDLTNSFFNVYVDTQRNYNENSNAPNNIVNATDGNVFLSGKLDQFSLTAGVVGNTLFGQVNALLSVTGGLAFDNFNTNTVEDGLGGFSDLTYTSSAQFGLGGSGTQFSNGTGELQGDTVAVPEPASLALLGIGLLGIGGMRYRKQKAVA